MIEKILLHIGKNRPERGVSEQMWLVPNAVKLFAVTVQSHENSAYLTLI